MRSFDPLACWPVAAAVVLTAACTGTAEPSPSPTAPVATPTPTLSSPAEAVLVDPGGGGEWLVVGLAGNETASGIRHPVVRLVLRDASGEEVARRTIGLPLDPFPPGGTWAYREAFRPAGRPVSVEALLIGETAAPSPPTRLSAEIVREFTDETGAPAAVGTITSTDTRPLGLEVIRLVGRRASGEIAEVIDADAAKDVLLPGETLAFVARLGSSAEHLAWEVHPTGEPTTAERVEAFLAWSAAHTDSQGNPFLTGLIENSADIPLAVRLIAVVTIDDLWLAGSHLTLPAPIAAGGQTAFSVRLPAAALGPAGSEVAWVVDVGAVAAAPGAAALPVEVIAFEPLGSSLLLRVRAAGPAGGAKAAVAGALLRAAGGEVVSAATAPLPDLAAGQSAVAVLTLPLPRGFDLTQAEFEVWGSAGP